MSFTQIPTSGFADEAVTEAKRSTGVTTITATSHTLAASDADTVLALENASPITVTVPANATTAIDVGTTFRLAQIGAGTVTVSPAGGVTVDSLGGTATAGQFAVVDLVKRATDAWILSPAV